MLYISKCNFTTVFNQTINKYERLELIDGDYENKVYLRFLLIDQINEKEPNPTVTISKDEIDVKLSIVSENKTAYLRKQIKQLEVATLQIKISSVMAGFYFLDWIPYDFIYKCWHDDQYLMAHFQTKWEGHCKTQGYASYTAFMRFYHELSTSNQKKLAKWIADWHLQETLVDS